MALIIRELMEATNVIDVGAKESVDKVKSLVDANLGKTETSKKTVNERRKKEVENGVGRIKEEGTTLEVGVAGCG